MRVPVQKVPIDVRRCAARHLESIRGTPLGVGADTARLGDEACPLYRPDVRGIAYWEIEVVGLRQVATEDASGRARMGSGFIIVSAGRHDVRIPHWSIDLNAPSRALADKAEHLPGGARPAKLYKLDALAYAAEDAKGTYLCHLGVFPPLLRIPAASLKKGPQTSTAVAQAAKPGEDDSKPGKLTLTASGAKPTTFKATGWKSWSEAKKGFATTFAPQLKALEQRAVVSWGVEDLTTEFGEGIHAGESLVVPLLQPGDVKLSGDGVAAVRMAKLDRDPPAAELYGLDVEEKREQHVKLEISYQDGTSELLPFFVVPEGTPSNHRPVLAHPVVTRVLADTQRPQREGG